jgi:DHA2 family multidrug resistance protein-like MFS transporter
MEIPYAEATSTVRHDGLPQPRRTLAFLTVATAVMMAVLDGSIVNVALPAIAAEQGVAGADAIWVITAYQLSVVVALLPMAALGEAIGFRKVYLGGLVLFVAASLLCAYSSSLAMLSASRIVQGVGAGALMSINGALVRHIMPSSQLGRGISGIALVVGISAAAGPSIASAILSVASWHWLFLINVPLGLFVLVSGYLTLPETTASGARFDFISAILNGAAFGGLISGLSSLGGNSLPLALGQLGVAAVAGFFLTRRQLARKAPMLPVDLLRRPLFASSIVASILSFTAQFLALVSLPFFFHDVLGRSEVETGLLLTPWPFATALMAVISGRLADRMSPVVLSSFGMALFAIGLACLAIMPAGPDNFDICWRLAICGLGFGLFQSPNNRLMITSAPIERSGGASGMQSTARMLGQSFGAALAAIILGMTLQQDLALAMWIATGCACLAGVASTFRRSSIAG